MNRFVFVLGFMGAVFTMIPLVAGPSIALADPTTCEASQDGTVTCSTDPPRPAPRLRGMRAFAADGFEQQVSGRIWDSLRNEECAWKSNLEATGEQVRCMPAFEWLRPGWFLDSACTQRVHWQPACEAGNVNYVRDDAIAPPWQTCSVQALDAVYPLGDPLPVGTLLYTDANGSCDPQPNAFGPNHAVRPLGPKTSIISFVPAIILPESP